MITTNINTINKTLHITADIYNIIMKNRAVINRCNNKELDNNTFYRNFYKRKSFEDLVKKKINYFVVISAEVILIIVRVL